MGSVSAFEGLTRAADLGVRGVSSRLMRRSADEALDQMRARLREEPPDVVKVHLYRPGVFGRWASPAFHDVMRGPSPWSTGERELFAAYTSRLLQCPF